MEFTNEIFFDKPLTADSTVIIKYSGKLYREHSKDVSIVYGYDENWAETDNSPMLETENGFEVTLTIKNYSTFNFCFTNSFNIWDNNFGCNYISPIIPKQESNDIVQEEIEEITEVESEINQANDNNSVENTNEATFENTEDTKCNPDQIIANNETTIESSENISSSENEQIYKDDIESTFSSLLDSILNDITSNEESIDVSNLPGYGLQSVDTITEEDMINCDEIFEELFEDLANEPNIETSEPSIEQDNTIANSTIEEESQKVTEQINSVSQELDSLMDNLLSSISENTETTSYATPVQEIKPQDLTNETVDLPAIPQKEDWVDKIINFTASFGKSVSTAFKKIGNLIKLKAKEFGLLNTK